MAQALAADARLRNPTMWGLLEGRERARRIFGILEAPLAGVQALSDAVAQRLARPAAG